MANVFGCGNFELLSSLLLQLVRQDSRTAGCFGLKIAQKTASSCASVACGADETYETMLRRAIEVDDNGGAILNVVIVTDTDTLLSCGDYTNFEKALKSCFVVTSDDKIALKLFTEGN